MVGGDVDRPAPECSIARVREAGQEPAQSVLGAARAVAASSVKRASSRPPKPIGPEPLPISTRPSLVVRK